MIGLILNLDIGGVPYFRHTLRRVCRRERESEDGSDPYCTCRPQIHTDATKEPMKKSQITYICLHFYRMNL